MARTIHPDIQLFWEQRGERIVFGPYHDNFHQYWRNDHVAIAHQYRDYPIHYRLLPDYTWISEEKMLRLIKLKAFL